MICADIHYLHVDKGIRDTLSAYSPKASQGNGTIEFEDKPSDGGAPPLSQIRPKEGDDDAVKSNASTLSDDVEEGTLDAQDATKRLGRIIGRKRVAARGGESDGHDTSEEGIEPKRKARKSARLG